MIRTACLAVLAASTLLTTQSASATINLNGRISQIVNGLHNDASFSPSDFSFTLNHGSASRHLFTGIEGVRALNGSDYALLNDWLDRQPASSSVFNGGAYTFTHSVLGSFFGGDEPSSVFNGGSYQFTSSVLDSYFDSPSPSALATRMMLTEPSHQSVSVQSGPVPEPATWAMMIGGFALVGAALRRRSVVSLA